MSTNEWLLTSDFWQFLEPWHGRWYENEIFIASCTDNIYDLENERWLLGDMIDHVGIYGSRVAEGLSAFNGGLVGVVFLCGYTCNGNSGKTGHKRGHKSVWDGRNLCPDHLTRTVKANLWSGDDEQVDCQGPVLQPYWRKTAYVIVIFYPSF